MRIHNMLSITLVFLVLVSSLASVSVGYGLSSNLGVGSTTPISMAALNLKEPGYTTELIDNPIPPLHKPIHIRQNPNK